MTNATMLLTEPKDRKLFDWLISTSVFGKGEFNSWDKPEEGRLMPVLVANCDKIDNHAYINSGLKSNPLFFHIPGMSQDQAFRSSFSPTLLRNLHTEYFIDPITKNGETQWFAISYFYPFSIPSFCDILNISPSKIAFNIVPPRYFSRNLSYTQ